MSLNAEQLLAEQARRRAAVEALLTKYPSEVQEAIRPLLEVSENVEAQLRESLLEVAELKRQFFGFKGEKLTPEEETQLAEVEADLDDQLEGEAPASHDVLEDDSEPSPEQQKRPKRRRHPLPEHLERETVILEPENLGPWPCISSSPASTTTSPTTPWSGSFASATTSWCPVSRWSSGWRTSPRSCNRSAA